MTEVRNFGRPQRLGYTKRPTGGGGNEHILPAIACFCFIVF